MTWLRLDVFGQRSASTTGIRLIRSTRRPDSSNPTLTPDLSCSAPRRTPPQPEDRAESSRVARRPRTDKGRLKLRAMPFGTAVAVLAAMAISTRLAAQDHHKQGPPRNQAWHARRKREPAALILITVDGSRQATDPGGDVRQRPTLPTPKLYFGDARYAFSPPLRGMSEVLHSLPGGLQPLPQRILPGPHMGGVVRGIHPLLLLRDPPGVEPLAVA
jgi:hypothetical protein